MTREGRLPTSKLTMEGDGPKTSYFRVVITRMVVEGRQHIKAISPPGLFKLTQHRKGVRIFLGPLHTTSALRLENCA